MGFCPQCGSEWREGITECKDCGVTLLPELPSDFKEPIGARRKLSEYLEVEDWHLPELDASYRVRLLGWLLLAFLLGYYLTGVVHSEYLSIVNQAGWIKSVVDRVDATISGASLTPWLIIAIPLVAIFLAMVDVRRRHLIIRATQYLAFSYALLFAIAFPLRFFTSWFDFYSRYPFGTTLSWCLDLLIICALLALAFLSMKFRKQIIEEESDE